MDIREQAVKLALSELGRENVTPDYDPHEKSFETETRLVDDVRLYGGDYEEVSRLFTVADVSNARVLATVRG